MARISMRIWVVGLLFVAAFGIVVFASPSVSPVSADGGPHVGTSFGSTPDQCAGCHRIHTAQGNKLLKSSASAICTSCHDGSGAQTNVNDGVYVATGEGLRGGGFINAKMDTGLTGTPAAAVASSQHTTDGAPATAWGGGDINGSPDYGTSITLECSNCHNPHGNGQYRILKQKPKEGFGGNDVGVTDEVSPTYTASYMTNYRRDTSYAPVGIGDWCAQCHTRYLASNDNNSGDAVFTYRHKSDASITGGASCLTCHVAHGSSATMGSWSGTVPWPNAAAGGGSTDSRLLHVDNRGVCMSCHASIGN